MTLADPASLSFEPSINANALAATAIRDPRLDFFRGMTMFIILIAHAPNNWLALWIPARFGFSDATEVFVFCSGMASAIAFGKVFRERGLPLGTARVAFRVWQVYWAHIGLFVAIAATMAALNGTGLFTRDYVGQLNLHPFFDNAEVNLMGLLTLTYVPNYFDILPMYLVVLAMMPLVIALAQFHKLAAFAFVIIVWIGANSGTLWLPAEPWSNREWFFNPFGWQLIFFTGFAFMSGWIPAPPVDRRLVILALVIVLAIVPLAYFRIINEVEAIRVWRGEWVLLIQKTDFGILRYVHFLALAYLAYVAVGPKGVRLLPPNTASLLASVWRATLAIIMKVGQQSLAIFITSMFLARLMGVAFDVLGRTVWTMTLVNATGFAILIAIAYGAGWFKSQPWRARRA
ncbi:MAG: hypothetical protein ACI8TF_001602 [Paracoccaceae bacterium]|jgi:hypothetical protein